MPDEWDPVSGEGERHRGASPSGQSDPAGTSEGEVPLLPRWLAERLRLPSRVRIIDRQFPRNRQRYLIQSGQAALGMLAILVFVDSLSDAALAAGLGSSVVIVFIHPSSHAAQARSVIGGHGLAILVGSALSLVLFAAPVAGFLEDKILVKDLSLALSVGVLIMMMAATDTEHPPAAGTVLGLSTRSWDPSTTATLPPFSSWP